MECVLCHTEVTLLELDVTFDAGPCHDYCSAAYRAELAVVLADAERMIASETNPRAHRRRGVST